jgi:hypothetical protein
MIKNEHWSLCKIPVVIIQMLMKTEVFDRFSKNTRVSNFMKIRPVGTELFYAYRQADRHDVANRRCSQFCERSQRGESLYSIFVASHVKNCHLIGHN